jgi:hypothetical protein
MAPHRPLVEQLFEEMKGRIKEDESSVPMRDGDWLYWWAFKPGAQYRAGTAVPRFKRPDQLIFDEPAEAEGKEYFRLGALEVSPDGRFWRHGRRQRLRAVQAAHPRSRHRQGYRDDHRGRDRLSGMDQPTAAESSSPRSTRIGAAIAPATTGSAPRPTRTRRSMKRPRTSAFRSGVAIRRTGASSSSAPATIRPPKCASCPPSDPLPSRC